MLEALALLAAAPLHAVPALVHQRLCIAVVAAWADLRAPDPWVEGAVRPTDAGLLCHGVLSLRKQMHNCALERDLPTALRAYGRPLNSALGTYHLWLTPTIFRQLMHAAPLCFRSQSSNRCTFAVPHRRQHFVPKPHLPLAFSQAKNICLFAVFHHFILLCLRRA